MSPGKLHQQQQHIIINGLRLSPLKINKASQLIHKQSSSSSSSSNNSLCNMGGETKREQQTQRNVNPVIIYTHSPKVIHTQARDFMALVQKLTGLSSSRNDEPSLLPAQQIQGSGVTNKGSDSKRGRSNENENSLISTDENCGGGGINSPILNPPKNPYFADIPLFTPTSVDYFCSPKPVYRYSESAYSSSPVIGNSVSPSAALEFIKGLPEY
ncbi:hypothetical protein RCOM_1308310 [Ricinus communis]|uniref:VQ domain-containing protein n=1 Tax=Ricinus communis TaxID=3988 RepID=B9SLW4_RICCO|nr:hypothetical protein RCOM_1308310 [Ricinus communis]|eukprot:XP_025014511.1 VQ motif-containing protein 8, chloroplastic [Ricinus communis]